MAYKTNDIEKKSIAAIKKNELVFIDEVPYAIGISKGTFYNHNLHELDSIKEALNENRITIKKGLRDKWYKSDNATVQIALYKLIGTDEESDKINSQKNSIEHSGAVSIPITKINYILPDGDNPKADPETA